MAPIIIGIRFRRFPITRNGWRLFWSSIPLFLRSINWLGEDIWLMWPMIPAILWDYTVLLGLEIVYE